MQSESRRRFLGKTLTAAGSLAASQLPAVKGWAQSSKPVQTEQLVEQLIDSLTKKQRASVILPYSSPLRKRVENFWHILGDKRVNNQFDRDQQALIRTIFFSLHSQQMRDQVWLQMLHDNKQKDTLTPDQIFGTTSVAIFQDEGSNDFEFVLTGRHITRRCSNVANSGIAFGGPIFYGHAPSFYEKPSHDGNAYWFQAEKANELFRSFNQEQQKQAQLGASRVERGLQTVELKGSNKGLSGIAVSSFNDSQDKKLKQLITELISPFRSHDQIQAASFINEQLADLHVGYFDKDDLGDDGVWDNWQLEGPNMVWYFRGNPHVHAWVHIKQPTKQKKA